MNQLLQNYIRQSFPEHSGLTVSEIFLKKHTDSKFMTDVYQIYDSSFTISSIIIKDLFFIDLFEFFQHHKNKYKHDFIDESCFGNFFDFGNGKFGINYNLYYSIDNSTSLFFHNNLKKNEINICYNNETVKYNKISFYYIMFKYIDFIKKNKLRSETIFSFFYGYLKHKTDITNFFDFFSYINTKITISEYLSMRPSLKNNYQDKHINIYHNRHNFYISDQDSNILLKKDLRVVAKCDFYNEIIKPFKDILTHFDDLNKMNFFNSWKEDAYKYFLGILEQKDRESVKIKINSPKFKSDFLDKIIYSQRPVIELSFMLNNEVVSYLKIDGNYDYHNKDIIQAYKFYKELSEIHSQNIELQNLINTDHLLEKKKRI